MHKNVVFSVCMHCTCALIFKKFVQSFWEALKHPLLSLKNHWYLYQTLKCTRSFSTIFHKLWNPVTLIIQLYWILFSCFQWLQISCLIVCWVSNLYEHPPNHIWWTYTAIGVNNETLYELIDSAHIFTKVWKLFPFTEFHTQVNI